MFCWFNVDQSYGRSFKTGIPKKKTHRPCIYSPWKLPYQLKLDGLVPFLGDEFSFIFGGGFIASNKREMFSRENTTDSSSQRDINLDSSPIQSGRWANWLFCSSSNLTHQLRSPKSPKSRKPHTQPQWQKKTRFFAPSYYNHWISHAQKSRMKNLLSSTRRIFHPFRSQSVLWPTPWKMNVWNPQSWRWMVKWWSSGFQLIRWSFF